MIITTTTMRGAINRVAGGVADSLSTPLITQIKIGIIVYEFSYSVVSG
jgi:hypothetical protein